MTDTLANFKKFGSVTVMYDDDAMTCRIFYNGAPTSITGRRDGYDDPFRVYVDHRPDSPIFVETPSWGMVGGISMLISALRGE